MAPLWGASAELTLNDQNLWERYVTHRDGVTIQDGELQSERENASFTVKLTREQFSTQQCKVQLKQSAEWKNWRAAKLYQPNMANAPVAISTGPHEHWLLAQFKSNESLLDNYKRSVSRAKSQGRAVPVSPYPLEGFKPQEAVLEGYDEPLLTTPFPHMYQATRAGADYTRPGYHAWHSRDMVNWVHYGLVAPNGTTTTAEYANGQFYIYYDNPNDRDPHVIIDADLRDGRIGNNLGMAFDAPWGGSDIGVIRDLEGNFHMISENWDPIDASKRSWDSPLASHAVSKTGVDAFSILDPAVDVRTEPTGKYGTFVHPHWREGENVVQYEIHEPKQDAFGDWAAISVGGQYYLFSDYEPANGHEMSIGMFTSSDINEQFSFYHQVGHGHPDPDVMFADGRFYIVAQTATDFVSDGPWVGSAHIRIGVDRDGDESVESWSEWQEVAESYDYTPGFAKQVQVTPAEASFEEIPTGENYFIEIKLTSKEGDTCLAKITELLVDFD